MPLTDRLVDVLARRSRVPFAVKSAFAASAAWLVVQPMPGVADRYPYYAPLGAVVAMGATVVTSFRTSVQSVLALMLGAGLGLAVRRLSVPEAAAIALVVAAGSLLAGWRRLGAMASWVTISSLFVLVIGHANSDDYALAYVGLTALGALVGLTVNVVVPPLPLTPACLSESELLESLAEQLDDLAAGLRRNPLLTAEEWRQRQHSIEPQTARMLSMVERTNEARRANWRARRWQEQADRQYAQARALQQLSFIVEDVTGLVADEEQADRDHVLLGPSLRPPAADAIEKMARALRSVEGASAEPRALSEAQCALDELVGAIRERRANTEDDFFGAATIVTALRRAIEAIAPREGADARPLTSH